MDLRLNGACESTWICLDLRWKHLLFRGRVAPFCTYICHAKHSVSLLEYMAGTTGLEPATSAVTGQRSNQLSYVPRCKLVHSGVCRKDACHNADNLLILS